MVFNVWSEFTPYEDLCSSLQELKTLGVSLNLAVHEGQHRDSSLSKLLLMARELGVDVRLWPLLTKQKGYWPNKWNIHEFRLYCLELVELHDFDWIIFDLEPHIELLLELEELLKLRKFWRARSLVLEWSKKGAGSEDFKTLLGELQSKGKKVQVVTMPMVLDDFEGRLQFHLGIPVMGLPWDEVSFMVYRPYFWDYLPGMPAGIVKSYSQDAKRIFSSKASIALGPIGSPMVTKSQNFYKGPEGPWEDIHAARTVGIERFSLFSLEGMKEQGGPARFLSGDPLEAAPSLLAYGLRQAVTLGLRLFL